MAGTSGPFIATDGLVFDYDMSNTQKSWIGAPTTNLVNPSWAAWTVDGSGQGSIGTRTITSIYECLISDTAANTRQNIYIAGIAASTTYTFSVQYKKVAGAPTLRFQLQAYNGGSYISTMIFATTAQLGILDIDGWQTAKYTVTTPAGTTQALWFMQDGDDYTTYTHAFILANPQCEQQSFATPFVAGTRSTTQSIKNLANLTSVTTSTSLTYASDNSFSFDGSTNYISAGTLSGSFSKFTVSVWFYSTSVSNYRNPIDCNFSYNGTTGNIGPRLEQNSAGNLNWAVSGNTTNNSLYDSFLVQSSGLLANTWYNVVITWTSGSANTYLNGVPVAINQATPNGFVNVFNNVVIGKGFHLDSASVRSFTGKIPAVQLYNRALSATEVQQNFNALRTRYGI
jgi:hypothetical protein